MPRVLGLLESAEKPAGGRRHPLGGARLPRLCSTCCGACPFLQACGCLGIGIVNGYEYLDFLDRSFDPSLYDLPAIKQAYVAADFIGISAYIPVARAQ